MARRPDRLRQRVDRLVEPGARRRLLARGLARGMVWRDGRLPIGGSSFPTSLTADLLDYGYGVLAIALELRDSNEARQGSAPFDTVDAFTAAAEALESAVRRGPRTDPNRGRHLVVAAAALHLAGFAARSFSLVPSSSPDDNLAAPERALAHLLRRDLAALREEAIGWLGHPDHSDTGYSRRLLDEADPTTAEDVVFEALCSQYFRAIGLADSALSIGRLEQFQSSRVALRSIVAHASSVGHLTIWWVAALSFHLVGDLWDQCLHTRLPERLPTDGAPQWERLRRGFIEALASRRPPQVDLWPSQLAAAARSIDPQDDLVIALPTSAGKTRIAELCILRALSDHGRVIYVTPLRALSAQVERVLARTFVPLGATVSALYGAAGTTAADATTLAHDDIVVATPEKLDFALRQDPNVLNDVSLVIFDEGHMIGLGSREIRYEVLIQRLLRRVDAEQRRIVCLSAMFNTEDPHFVDFTRWLRSDAPGEPLRVRWRPTRKRLATLDWQSSTASGRLAFLNDVEAFVPRFVDSQPPSGRRRRPYPADEAEFCVAATNAFARDGHGILVYSPQRSQIEPLVEQFTQAHRYGYVPDVPAPSADALAVALAIGREWLGVDHPAMAALAIGVGTHHGALPRPFLAAVESLLHSRRLAVVVASPTLAQGVDLACSVLIFRSLHRFDPTTDRPAPIAAAEFANVLGRAGRAFVDIDGIAVLPTFESGWKRDNRHRAFRQLIDEMGHLQIVSGLAQLVLTVASLLAQRVGHSTEALADYVINHDLWATTSEPSVNAEGDEEGDDEDGAKSLREYVADLDLAILSLVDPLDTDIADLATTLDDILRSSLWRRSLEHGTPEIARTQSSVFYSRASWLWARTTVVQRRACYSSGLGYEAGVFLYSRLDELVTLLADMQRAVATDSTSEAVAAAVAFADAILVEPTFSSGRLPLDWRRCLEDWVTGVAFREMLAGKKMRERQRIQSFIQDTVVFRFVWAAEAVRVQALSSMHERRLGLGEGPALALTYGVPNAQAALLCQRGYSSRVGALWASRALSASFTDTEGREEWVGLNEARLGSRDFWQEDDHYLLWARSTGSGHEERPSFWDRRQFVVAPSWSEQPLAEGTLVRVVHRQGADAVVCSVDLTPLGTVSLPNGVESVVLKGTVVGGARLRIDYFGRWFGPP